MVVRQGKSRGKEGVRYHSEMRCWCSKPDSIGKSGICCAKYSSFKPKALSQDEMDHLFKHKAKGKMNKLLHLRDELSELKGQK